MYLTGCFNAFAHHFFVFYVCYGFVSVHCSLVVTCYERADL